MVDIFDEGARQARAKDALKLLEEEIMLGARKKIRALNDQIPELCRRLNSSRLAVDLEFDGWRLVENTAKPLYIGVGRSWRCGLRLLSTGVVQEYGSGFEPRPYDAGQDLPPGYLQASSLNDALFPKRFEGSDPTPKGGVVEFGYQFRGDLDRIQASLGASSMTTDPRSISEYAKRVYAWAESYERGLIGLSSRMQAAGEAAPGEGPPRPVIAALMPEGVQVVHQVAREAAANLRNHRVKPVVILHEDGAKGGRYQYRKTKVWAGSFDGTSLVRSSPYKHGPSLNPFDRKPGLAFDVEGNIYRLLDFSLQASSELRSAAIMDDSAIAFGPDQSIWQQLQSRGGGPESVLEAWHKFFEDATRQNLPSS